MSETKGHDSGESHETRARTRTVLAIVLVAICVLLLLLVIGLIPRIGNNRELARAARTTQSAIPKVYVVKPQHPPASELTLAATTQATPDAVIYARTSGYVSRRYVDIGDRVKAGQLMAIVESPEVEEQLRQGRADLSQSEKNLALQRTNLDLARITMERYKGADAEGAVAKQLLDQSIAAFQTAVSAVAAGEANVQSNRANVGRLKQLTSFQRVVAPFDGTVLQRNVDVGSLITAGSPVNNVAQSPVSVGAGPNGLFEVGRIEVLRVFVSVPQAFAPNVKKRLPVKVEARGHLEEPIAAKVTRTAVGLDPGTRTLLVQVDIPNESYRLFPGMFVYVTFDVGPSGTRWRIPSTALITDARGTRVIVVDEGDRLRFREVRVGRDSGAVVDIQAGLEGNERIVRQPVLALKEGERVQPIVFREETRQQSLR
jgi:multidrug efflux pump subunit AcrA (membrane-fusion protein)